MSEKLSTNRWLEWAQNKVLSRIPYKQGGKTAQGLDCFGLVELAYRELKGVDIANGRFYLVYPEFHQAHSGYGVHMDNIGFTPGDVLVVSRDKTYPHHVMLVISDCEVIHIFDDVVGICIEKLEKLRANKRELYAILRWEPTH